MDQRDLSLAYKAVFEGPHAETVLIDLSTFCAHTGTTFPTDADGKVIVPVDQNVVMMMEGRRQVFLWIKNLLSLDDRQLVEWKQAQFERVRSRTQDWTAA